MQLKAYNVRPKHEREELPGLFRAEHRSFSTPNGILWPTDRTRRVHRQDTTRHQVIEEHPDRRQVLLH